MAMKKKAAPKNTGASDKAKKAQAERLQKDAEARKKSGQSYVDKRGKGIGIMFNDTAGYYAATPQSSKNLSMGLDATGKPVKFGKFGRTQQRLENQRARANKKAAPERARTTKQKQR